MDLYDLFVMRSLENINPNLVFPQNAAGNQQQNEATLRALTFAKMDALISKNKFRNVFSYGGDGSHITVENPKTRSANHNSLTTYSNRIFSDHFRGRDNIASEKFKPDLIIHNPNNYLFQHIACEFKVGIDNTLVQYKQDICKLLGYIKILSFRRAYFIFTKENPHSIIGNLRDLLPDNYDIEGINKLNIIFPVSKTQEKYTWTCIPFLDLPKVIQN